MSQAFDSFEYIDYLRRRWRLVAAACLAAGVLSLGVSLLLPKRYTAVASIVIEPPGGTDSRTSTAIYLESLKTYERFASSDTLFERAAQRFHLWQPESSSNIESLKTRVLKVSKLRDTKILEIDVTLPDPQVAQQLVQYLAEETAAMNRQENLDIDRDMVQEAERQVASSAVLIETARNAWIATSLNDSLDALQSELTADIGTQAKLREEINESQADLAAYQERATQPGEMFAQKEVPEIQAGLAVSRRLAEETAAAIGRLSAELSQRISRREKVQSDLRMAQAALDATQVRLRDVRAAAGMRGDRLRVIDPGIVPQQPSSPNIPLNVAAAAFLATILGLTWLSVAHAYRRKSEAEELPRSFSRHA